MHPDRCFDAEPGVRRVARELYEGTRALPIVSPHGHVDARLLATNEPFPDPAALLVTPDHYVLRMLYARGVPLESLGVAPRDEGPFERDPRRIWRRFAERYGVYAGTPTGLWLNYELHELFGIRERLNADTADRVYDAIAERLASPELRPRALFDRFNIELLATTDAASDSLEHHQAIRRSGWNARVIPTFRPDGVFRICSSGWKGAVAALGSAVGRTVESAEQLMAALAARRAFFKQMGATATDHGVTEPYTDIVSAGEAEQLFERASRGEATAADQRRWEAHLLMTMARLSAEDGLVMQLHAGAFRDHHARLFERFGPDIGGDIPITTEYTRNLRPLLDAFGGEERFSLILFTLDESTYSRELAPLAGHYPAVRLGAPWWFHDSLDGMTRFLDRTAETAGIDKLAGFTDDTRAFCSIPARHDLSRRVQANWLARLVSRHLIDLSDAHAFARRLAYDLAKQSYKLDAA
jgi:glucuronate isomerase